MPPIASGWFLRSATAWERFGSAIASPFAGVLVVEATKQVYRPIAVRRERRRLIPVMEPVLVPTTSPRRPEAGQKEIEPRSGSLAAQFNARSRFGRNNQSPAVPGRSRRRRAGRSLRLPAAARGDGAGGDAGNDRRARAVYDRRFRIPPLGCGCCPPVMNDGRRSISPIAASGPAVVAAGNSRGLLLSLKRLALIRLFARRIGGWAVAAGAVRNRARRRRRRIASPSPPIVANSPSGRGCSVETAAVDSAGTAPARRR